MALLIADSIPPPNLEGVQLGSAFGANPVLLLSPTTQPFITLTFRDYDIRWD